MKKFNNADTVKAYAAYTGQNIENYLIQFKRESDENFEIRKQSTNYDNLIKPIVDSLVDPIFSFNITREYNNLLLDVYMQDYNLLKDDYDMLMHEVAVAKTLVGNGFVVTDNVLEIIGKTVAEQAANRELPYSRFKRLSELYQYETNKYGQITVYEFYNGVDEDNNQKIIGYTKDMVYEYVVAKGKKTDYKEYKHTLGRIPVVSINGTISETPVMKDLVAANITLYNKQSELRNFERESATIILDLPTTEDIDKILLKQFNIIRTSEDGRGLSFISPDSNVLRSLQDGVVKAYENIEAQAQRFGSQTIKSVKSGEALKMEFLGTSYKLKTLSKILESLDKEIISLFYYFINAPFDYDVTYPDEFIDPVTSKENEIKVLNDFANLITTIENIGIDATSARELLQSFINEI